MAKVLDALEKARQERLRNIEATPRETGASVLAEVDPLSGDDELSAAPAAQRPDPSASLHPITPLSTGFSDQIVSAFDNQSPIAEQLRHIRTNLETVLSEYRSRPIVISSPVTGDGKTIVTANLAVVLADSTEHRCLVVDADMRKPDVHRLFGVRQTPGLSGYLRGQHTLDEIICTTSLPNLDVIPTGHRPDNPTALLSSDRLATLLGDLQRTYHWIIFDTPPILPVTDACVLARECLGMILVTRMGQTPRSLIERAQEMLAEMNMPVLGCILNDFTSHIRRNDYYNKYYGQRKDSKNGFES